MQQQFSVLIALESAKSYSYNPICTGNLQNFAVPANLGGTIHPSFRTSEQTCRDLT